MLPNFLIIGAEKSGTTSLYYYLKQHPAIFMSEVKETNFFAYDRKKPGLRVWGKWGNYTFPVKQFSEYTALFENSQAYDRRGECSPLYLVSEYAPRKIKEILGEDIKLLAILRNPVYRAYSDYLKYIRKNDQNINISRDFQGEYSKEWILYGFYYQYLKRYYQLFSSTNIHIEIFEEFIGNVEEGMQRIYQFLGVNPDFKIKRNTYNKGGVPKSMTINFLAERMKKVLFPVLPVIIKKRLKYMYRINYKKAPSLPKEIFEEMIKIYIEDIKNLEDLLHRPLDCWYRE